MTTIGICDRRFQRSSFVTITSAPCSGRLLSVRHLGFVARYCQLAVGCAFTNVLVNRIDCHSLGVAENAPVIASQIVSTAAQRFDEYFQKRQNAGHTTGQPLGNGVEKLIRSSQVLDVFLEIVDKGRTVESDQLAGDSGVSFPTSRVPRRRTPVRLGSARPLYLGHEAPSYRVSARRSAQSVLLQDAGGLQQEDGSLPQSARRHSALGT